MGTTSIVCW